MLRLLFTMITTVLIGLGTGYFLWGSRVANLTQTLSGLTLELDTMRARSAGCAPADQAAATRSGDELRVINESVAAMRQDLADQKALLEKSAAAAPAAAAVDSQAAANAAAAANTAEVVKLRHELAECVADKQDLEAKCALGTVRQPAPAPSQAPGDNPVYRELVPVAPR